MNDKVKNAFSSIHADEALKIKTFKNITSKRRIPLGYQLVPVMIVFALLFLGNLYYTPVVYISIDINPSIELEINRFDRVLEVVASNEDAKEIVEAVNLRNKNYIEALELLKADESFEAFANSYTEVTVISNSNKTMDTLITSIQTCNFYGENVRCYGENSKLKVDASAYHISFGKYRAYLELQEVIPDISIDEISDLSMAEIRVLIDGGTETGYQNGNRQNGNRHGREK